MSYILEALKKSQQARELGRVPTLEKAALFEEDRAEPRQGPWLAVAFGIAAAALALALYGVLRPPGPPVAAPVPPALSREPAASRVGPKVADTGSSSPTPSGPSPSTDSKDSQGRPALPAETGKDQSPSGVVPASPPPLVEAPPPKGGQAPRAIPETPASAAVAGRPLELGDPGLQAELDAEIQRELERRLPEDMAAAATVPAAARAPGPVQGGSDPTPVPKDLIADIESFKRQVGGGSRKTAATVGTVSSRREPAPVDSAPAAPTGSPVPDTPHQGPAGEDPTTLSLTPDQQAAVPPYAMTVHVYSADSAQRFVLINGLKYREGDETREGLRVSRILPDGAVLSYRGNPFYVRR